MLTVSDVSLRFKGSKIIWRGQYQAYSRKYLRPDWGQWCRKINLPQNPAGDIEPTTGHISLGPDERLSVLRQNHFDYEDERVIDVVIMGNEHLYNIMKEKDAIYMKPDFSDEDGVRAAELEGEFAELGGLGSGKRSLSITPKPQHSWGPALPKHERIDQQWEGQGPPTSPLW